MLQALPDGDVLLAAAGEFRPADGDSVVKGQIAALGEQVHQQRDEGLAGREQEEQRIGAAVKRLVQHNPAAHRDAQLRRATPFPDEIERPADHVMRARAC